MYALIAVVFIVGYLFIAFEHPLKIDKSASALLTAVLVWTILMLGADEILAPLKTASEHLTTMDYTTFIKKDLSHHLSEIAEILFFLLGAMTIVELIDAHDGFKVITNRITTNNRIKLLWILSFFAFFLSAALDNLTTTIVMISLIRKLIDDKHERWLYASMLVIAANAGGAWSPIGDVTTTMLWIGGQITAQNTMLKLFLPSLACLLVPLIILSFKLSGNIVRPTILATPDNPSHSPTTVFEQNLVFLLGLGSLMFVPIFKTITHLPPYMGILFGLSVLWITTELIHRGKNAEDKHALSVVGVIRRIDAPSILFFLGILLAVSALSTAGHLSQIATWLQATLGNVYAINLVIGLLSSIVDNVPLVAGAMKMYPLVDPTTLAMAGEQSSWLSNFTSDGVFWELLALCAGTGGSCLIIGSAAGVAAMGLEKIDFIWYLKKITLLALSGYFAAIATYMLITPFIH